MSEASFHWKNTDKIVADPNLTSSLLLLFFFVCREVFFFVMAPFQ